MSVTINLSEANTVTLTNAQPSAVTVSGSVGDITGITINAGDGLTGGGTDTSGAVSLSLAVGAGTGIAVSSDAVALDHLGLEDLTAPASDKVFFYDVSQNAAKFLTLGDNLSITDDTLNAVAVSGDQPAIIDSSGTPTLATGITGEEVRTAIGAGTSDFSGSYNDLTNKPTIPSAANNATITIEAGSGLSTGGNFTTDQATNETITLTNSDKGSDQNIYKNVAADTGTAVADTNNDTLTISGGTGISTSATADTITIVNDSPDQTVSLTAGDNVTVTGTYPNFTIASTDTDTNTQLSDEEVQDVVGAMVTGNTETNISVTYDDTNGKLNFAATDTDTVTSVGISGSEASGTITIAGSGATSVAQSGNTITISSTDTDTNTQLTDEEVQDVVGGMVTGNTETNITVTYDDATGKLNFSATDTDTITSVGVSGSEASGTITLAGSGATSISQVGNTITISSTDTDTNTQLSTEQVQDIIGAMFSGNTETLITVTYDDTDGTIDLVVDNDLSNYDNSTSGFLTAHPSIAAAASVDNSGRTYIQDITLDSNGHVTGITSATETVTNTDTQLTDEEVQDVVGAMVTGNTETNITVTYDDTNGKLNFSATDTDTVTSVGISGSETTGTVTLAASGAASISQAGSTVTISATDTDTTYSTATASTEGLVKIGYTETGKNYPVELDSGQMYVNVPWTDTDTDTVTSVGVSGSETTGTVTIAASGAASVSQVGSTVTISATDTDTTYSTATASTEGLVKIGYTENGKNYPVELSNGQMFVNVPWVDTDTDTTYTAGGDYGITLSGTEFRLEDDRRRNSTSTDIYTGNTHDYTFYDASIGIRWYTSGAEEMRLENDGDLHVDGDVIAYSTTVSDQRLKDDVETITDACEKVCNLRGVEYTWNAGSRKGKREIGVIAQEVEKVVPEIVHNKKLALVDGEEYKTVDYEKLVALLIEANKELCERVQTLEAKVNGVTE